MTSCVLLVGPQRWCESNKIIIDNNKESWIFYDKFPKNEIDIKRIKEFMEKGNFLTCICITKRWGGNGDIEYVTYTPSIKDNEKIIDGPGENEYYLDEQFIENFKIIRTPKTGKYKPIKPPGPCPSWDLSYDFIDPGEFLPRPYNIAIKIKDIQAIHVPLGEFKNVKDLAPINNGQLENSFIIAQTKNKYIEDYKKNIRQKY